LDHDLAYRQIKMGAIDLMDVYATDAEIAKYNLTLLEDDREHFPRYDAVLLYRDDLPERAPDALESMLRLVGGISREQMMQMNSQVVNDRRTPERVTAEFLSDRFGVESESSDDTLAQRVWQRTGEHLDLVRKSLIPAILIAIPLGVFAAKYPRIGQGILAVVGTIQTIPSLALLVVLMPVIAWLGASSVGPGSATAVTALLLYSLLPIVRNTHAGLHGIEGEYREAAASLGLPAMFRLVHIELPLASRSILAGIKTAAVLNVGFATLGALIGAGGYGQTILQGIRLNDTARILEGAIPSAVLALVVQAGFELSERFVVPAGLRIKRAS
ncbi:MAG: ABC transporter permease subunit, partial [Planctomycetota bacterium]